MKVKQLEARARVIRDIHAFFESRYFTHVDTPAIVPSPGMDVHLDAFAVEVKPGKKSWLATSPEYQMKRLVAGGHSRIYQLSRSYRRDEEGHVHNPEFSILEWYRSHATIFDVMADTEQLVARVTGGAIEKKGRRISTLPPFLKLTVLDAYERWCGASAHETLAMAEHDEDRFYRLLIERIEPEIASLNVPVFLHEYPTCMASLARKKPEDARVAERFELYLGGVEVCNGFGELTDGAEQRARFEHDQHVRTELGKDVYPIDEKFLAAMNALPPCAGNALGVDRLVMLACGAESIGEVMAFAWDEL